MRRRKKRHSHAHDSAPDGAQHAAPSPSDSSLLPRRANGYRLAPILPGTNFAGMLGFVAIPGSANEAVVLTQGGVIYRVALDDSFAPTVFGDVSSLLIDNPGSEEGLLGLAFSPSFASDGRVFIDYTAGNPRRSVLARFGVKGGAMDMTSERVILEVPQPFANHNGGQLAFGPDGFLYYGLGDGGSEGDPQENGQKISTLLSSILRLDVSGDTYTVPPSNPFVKIVGAAPEKYAYGLRNPWRFSFDSSTGALWVGDVGQNKWEEVDRIDAGANYGWSIMEGFECYRTPNCDQTGLTYRAPSTATTLAAPSSAATSIAATRCRSSRLVRLWRLLQRERLGAGHDDEQRSGPSRAARPSNHFIRRAAERRDSRHQLR